MTKRALRAMAWGYGTCFPLGLLAVFLCGFFGTPYSVAVALASLFFLAGFVVTFWRLNLLAP